MVNDNLEHMIQIPINSRSLEGVLGIPKDAQAIILFAHGSGSGRHSPRNNFVARVLRQGNLGTLLIDLLTEEEDTNYETRFDIDLLARRLLIATKWLREQASTRDLRIGYFGASTGAAAALKAAASVGNLIGAVVSRGGRPDLAEPYLDQVQTPTLLIVGGNDDIVIELNQYAYKKLRTEKDLVIIPGATHLFEEPGALEEVARLATQWFKKYLISKPEEAI